VTFYLDGVSLLTFTLVSFIGWVISQYSIRYLDGDPSQGNYFRWVAVTVGSVTLMTLSGNVGLLALFWVTASVGLHHLLLHFPDRSAAQRAAWTKFTISRLGDASLVAASVLIYANFKTWDLAEIFQQVQSGDSVGGASISVLAFLFVLTGITKSVQFPFHTWVPLSMETPTPVSALMHAGIVNAGGYLIIRFSPLVALTPAALATLAIFGAVTACGAAVIMMTQTSVKKTLAYSTIAQMGFMMLQCGLGAYSAAMLHILAHSLYKAHAFLSSGSVMTRRAATRGSRPASRGLTWYEFLIIATLTITLCGLALTWFGLDPTKKPGGLLLAGVLCAALTQWIGRVTRTGDSVLLARAISVAALLSVAYAAAYSAVDHTISSSLPAAGLSLAAPVIGVLIFAGFAALWALQSLATAQTPPAWLRSLYVHASNGFYIESLLRRLIAPLAST